MLGRLVDGELYRFSGFVQTGEFEVLKVGNDRVFGLFSLGEGTTCEVGVNLFLCFIQVATQ